jgi:hypothetical protein
MSDAEDFDNADAGDAGFLLSGFGRGAQGIKEFNGEKIEYVEEMYKTCEENGI